MIEVTEITMTDTKDFFNIVFFITMIVIAILSFLQARKSLFAPIKTEIFKLQVNAFQDVLKFFNEHSPHDFDQIFEIPTIFSMNAEHLRIAYIETFFKDEISLNEEHLNSLRDAAVGAILVREHVTLNAFVIPGEELEETKPKEEKQLSPEMKLAKWNEYKHFQINFTHGYQEQMEVLAELASSPLLPKQLTDLIYEFKEIIEKNLFLMSSHLTEAATKLPTKYPTAQDIMKLKQDWMWIKFNHERDKTDETVNKILKYIHSYLKINEIMKDS